MFECPAHQYVWALAGHLDKEEEEEESIERWDQNVTS